MESDTPSALGRRQFCRSHRAMLGAATEIAGRQGYGSATIKAIAAEAGVGKPSIYWWWPNKAALFIEVYGRLVPSDLTADGSLAGDLNALLARLGFYRENPAGNISSGLIAEAKTDSALAEQPRKSYVGPRRRTLRSIFARAAGRGEIQPPDDLDLASALFSGAIWFRLLFGERHLDQAFAPRFIAALIRGVARPRTNA
jgi:AcrR family transcriptional regulator